jgi:hypothetical protein
MPGMVLLGWLACGWRCCGRWTRERPFLCVCAPWTRVRQTGDQVLVYGSSRPEACMFMCCAGDPMLVEWAALPQLNVSDAPRDPPLNTFCTRTREDLT